MIRTAIIGASGYSGAELVRLLSLHSEISIERLIANTSAGKQFDEVYPAFAGSVDLRLESFDQSALEGFDLVFIALPSGEAMTIVPELIGRVARIIDLGGDYRLPSAALYKQFYQRTHASPQLLGKAVYGLPELNRDRIATARLVANPGCYATSVLLPLLPALRHDLLDTSSIVINSLSGVSGAGRSASLETSFSEINENIRAYKVGVHQHVPEIESVLSDASGGAVVISFVPHLVPLTRGIYTTIQAPLRKKLGERELNNLYQAEYRDEQFVRVRQGIPQIRDVVYTNYCDIGIRTDSRADRLILFSVIDNMVKGAAGQAIQNMNIMFDFPEYQGLLNEPARKQAGKEKNYVH